MLHSTVYYNNNALNVICRGDCLRHEFACLGEVRSIIPKSVKVMALTATATDTTRSFIIRSLDMEKPKVVSVSPMKENIVYSVGQKSTISETFLPHGQKLQYIWRTSRKL